jgi:hypothetical protein
MNDTADINERREGAFGVPDGNRESIEESRFVELDASVAQSGLVSHPDDRTARVIVGKKGSGKTVYLRRFQAAARAEESIYAGHVDPNTPTTADIVTFSRWYSGEDLAERWRLAWRAAILGSVASHVAYEPSLDEYGTPAQRTKLLELLRELMPEVGAPRSAYQQLTELIGAHNSGRHLDGELRKGRWSDLEYWLGAILHDAPPICFYLDAVDEQYAAAPNLWLPCQKGLFHQVMHFLRDPTFGGRLHLVIAVRDNVFASVLRSEHATRYRTDPHIRILAWDRPAIGFLLQEKLDRLTGDEVMRPSAPRGVAAWLGAETVFNEDRQLNEGLEDYLLRHTRMLPRDVVLLGNALAEEVAKARTSGRRAVPEERIRAVVSRVANWCGTEQLAVCGNQIVSDQTPRSARPEHVVESHIGSLAYQRHVQDVIGSLVRGIGTDQFDGDRLAQLMARGEREFGSGIDVATVLWQNGLLGYRDLRTGDGDWIFHGVEDVDRFHLPLERERYAIHPCLLDALGFKGDGPGTRPVRPWRKETR